MVGVPGTQERLALADIEDRLRRLRGRLNRYTFQHRVYIFGTALALVSCVLIVCAYKLELASPLFAWVSWPLGLGLLVLLFVSLRRGVREWADVVRAARRADQRAGLQERVSTLAAQLQDGVVGTAPPSRLWPHLLADNTARLADWDLPKVAPRRIPWTSLPFLAALGLLSLTSLIPSLSSQQQDDPFSLVNMQQLAQNLPERMEKLIDEQMSLIPPASENWGESSMFPQNETPAAEGQDQPMAMDGDTTNPALQTLASLSDELQQSIRDTLHGLSIPPTPDPSAQPEAPTAPPLPDHLDLDALQAAITPKDQADYSIQGTDRPQGGRTREATDAAGPAGMPTQGSGLQQLSQARLGRKNARGSFQPQTPQMPGSGGSAGGAGMGAGSGTDPNLFGNRASLGDSPQTFQLSLDSTYELTRGGDGEPVKYEGELPPSKSRRRLSQEQSLDDAIRKAKIPPEYEAIVKRLFSRGGSR
ncbi:MAG: hypothetical protein J4F42_09770 [Desulfurellaceae bacterium]|nr:hypothetical protein [Desulfurellaceae bacterium]